MDAGYVARRFVASPAGLKQKLVGLDLRKSAVYAISRFNGAHSSMNKTTRSYNVWVSAICLIVGAIIIFCAATLTVTADIERRMSSGKKADTLSPGKTHPAGDNVQGKVSVKISLRAQNAILYRGDRFAGDAPISSARKGFTTPTGEFTIIEKNENHDNGGYFMRLTKNLALCEGHLPGYPSSDGNVLLSHFSAELFFKSVSIGTPVTITD